MRLKVQRHVDQIRPVTILDDALTKVHFEVDVRACTRLQQEQLIESCSKQKFNTMLGRNEPELDEKLWQEKAPDSYIAGWRGLTPSVIRLMGVPLAEDPPTDGDGCIAYDAELARDLWRYADAGKFANPIATTAREIIALAEREKKLSSNGSGT